MPGVTKKTKQKVAAKTSPAKVEKKFISESLQNKKPKKVPHKKTPKHRRRGVVYIKHLPHGFYEEELRGYFSQFGAITRLRLARSPKTLGSKGYAFIEFRYPEVAEIAADAMNNYLMFKNIIKTRYIPPNDIKHDYFRSSVKKVKKDGEKVLTSKAVEARDAVVDNTNKLMTAEDEKVRGMKVGSKISKQKQKLAALGIDYDVDEVAGDLATAPSSSPPKAAAAQPLNDSTTDADETLDAEKLDIDSEDEFEDFEYESEGSDDDEEDEKIEVAVKKAREATKTAKIEEPKPAEQKKGKRKETAAEETVEVPVKKAKEEPKKAGKKGKAAAAKVPETVEDDEEEEEETPEDIPAPTKKGKKSPVNKKPAGKQAAKPVESPVQAPVRAKRGKPQVEVPAPVEKVPEQKGRAKKGKSAAPASPPAEPQPKKAAKKAAPVQESPQPAKTKKLAKASAAIEKKKPVAKADKKMKLAAKAATSTEGAEIVKVVKGKEIKGKKKAAKK